jgi:uncharacterized membrane protein YkvA (DUF1232 family)
MSRVTQRFDLTFGDKAIIAVAAVYVLSPFDLIPEAVAGPLGLTDDVAALAVVAVILLRGHRRAKNSAPAEVGPGSQQADETAGAATA